MAKAPANNGKQTDASKEMSMAEVHLDGLISDALYLQTTLEGLLSRRGEFFAKREIAIQLSEVSLIAKALSASKDDLSPFSLQWSIDALVEGGTQRLSETLTPALEVLIFKPAINKVVSLVGNNAIQANQDHVYHAISSELEGRGFSLTAAHELVSRRMEDIYHAIARIVPMPSRSFGSESF